MATPTFAPAQPHGPLQEIFPDVFVVRGTFRFGPGMSIARNMIVLREGGDLTLVNAVRLSAEGEAELEKLGAVKHLVKLGFFHTLDDPYYRSRYEPRFWTTAPADDKSEKLADGEAGPVKRARVFCFEHAKDGEAALLVEQDAGTLLVTCDSVQNWADTAGCSLAGKLVCHAMGLVGPAKIGPMWLKQMSDGKRAVLRPDFDRLLSLDFRHLIAGHGQLLRDEAKSALGRSVAKTFARS